MRRKAERERSGKANPYKIPSFKTGFFVIPAGQGFEPEERVRPGREADGSTLVRQSRARTQRRSVSEANPSQSPSFKTGFLLFRRVRDLNPKCSSSKLGRVKSYKKKFIVKVRGRG